MIFRETGKTFGEFSCGMDGKAHQACIILLYELDELINPIPAFPKGKGQEETTFSSFFINFTNLMNLINLTTPSWPSPRGIIPQGEGERNSGVLQVLPLGRI